MKNVKRGLALVALGVAMGAVAPAVVRSQAATVTTTIEPVVEGQDVQTTITVKGDAGLKDGAKLVVVLLHKDIKVEERVTTVGAGKYIVKFGPWKNRILFPGKYDAQIVLNPTIQKEALKTELQGTKLSLDKVTFDVGDLADVPYREYTVKAKIIDVLENVRLGYLDLCQAGSYYRAELQLLNIESRVIGIPEDKHQEHLKRYIKRKAEIFPAWQEIARANWDERFKTTKYDWKTFRGQIVVSPFPTVEQKVEELFGLYEAWYKGMSTQIHKLCNQTVPADLAQETDTDPLKLDPQIVATAHACYRGLGYPSMPEWRVSDLSQAEKGELKDGIWRSYISKFEIRCPDAWSFYPGGNKPAIRITFKPPEVKDAKAPSTTLIAVEILDYAMAESAKHLAQLAREMNRGRWRGAKEIKSENINAPDRTMPGSGTGGKGGGETKIEDGKYKLHCRYYQLFCRWHKRTYGVLCMAPQDKWSEAEETFKKTCASFKVLDAPEYEELREKEKREAIMKEGRDPKEAMRKAHQFGADDKDKKDAPKDVPKDPKDPKDPPK